MSVLADLDDFLSDLTAYPRGVTSPISVAKPCVIDLSANQSPMTVAYSLNILRTHYTPSQRAMFAAQLAKWPSGKTKAKVSQLRHLKTAADAAKEAGVHRARVMHAKLIRRSAPGPSAAAGRNPLTKPLTEG